MRIKYFEESISWDSQLFACVVSLGVVTLNNSKSVDGKKQEQILSFEIIIINVNTKKNAEVLHGVRFLKLQTQMEF